MDCGRAARCYERQQLALDRKECNTLVEGSFNSLNCHFGPIFQINFHSVTFAQDRIRKLLSDFEIKDKSIECKITEVEKVDGEATANNRKGKLIFFYEWNVSLKWNGYLPGQEKPCEGKINIPNLSEENDLDDVQIDITMNESTDESHKLKQFMYNVGRDHIRKQLGIYLKELREEFSKGLILPKKDDIINQV